MRDVGGWPLGSTPIPLCLQKILEMGGPTPGCTWFKAIKIIIQWLLASPNPDFNLPFKNRNIGDNMGVWEKGYFICRDLNHWARGCPQSTNPGWGCTWGKRGSAWWTPTSSATVEPRRTAPRPRLTTTSPTTGPRVGWRAARLEERDGTSVYSVFSGKWYTYTHMHEQWRSACCT